MAFRLASIILLLQLFFAADAGPMTYTIGQACCSAGRVACYAAAGPVAGTVSGGIGAPVAALACNSAMSGCSVACAPLIPVPAP